MHGGRAGVALLVAAVAALPPSRRLRVVKVGDETAPAREDTPEAFFGNERFGERSSPEFRGTLRSSARRRSVSWWGLQRAEVMVWTLGCALAVVVGLTVGLVAARL